MISVGSHVLICIIPANTEYVLLLLLCEACFHT
jgi:hypothetical protein